MPQDLRMTRYYWTWQACSLAFAVACGGATYLVVRLTAQPDFAAGVIVGVVAANAWYRTKWKDGDR